ncbi:MAG: serine/threonine protein kinase [Deltaproteobacteria bacterium]|nr:serine/threonine protein kinase [Deltaproteobacteria bacterium]
MSDAEPTRRLDPAADRADEPTRPMGTAHLADTIPSPSSPSSSNGGASSDKLASGERIGRFVVVDVLGRGGMGLVYAAYDPELDRKIAVKLLHGPSQEEEATEGRARMQREAQALARLNHPNVITVHDVGEHGGAMYIAMELVPGGTLGDWQRGRSWRDVLNAYESAARGLAAAHAAGLVHRDFKPENVLVGDGRIRVTDFGLARLASAVPPPDAKEAAAAAASSTSSSMSTSSSGGRLASQLTAAGAVMGTPSYMAPEQIEGGAVDARSDQFSWCLALWEALHGEQPWPKGNLALRAAAMRVDVPKIPPRGAVPRGIYRVLARGLAPEAADRWPDLEAALAELRRVTSKRRAAIAGSAAAATVALAGVFVIGQRAAGSPPEPCVDTDAPLAGVWSDGVRARLAAAFEETRVPYAAGAAASVGRAIDAWAARWRTQALDSCRATRVVGVQSEAVLDARTACLAQRRDQLANMVGVFLEADPALVESSRSIALPDLDACADVVLAGVAPPDPAHASERAEIERGLDELDRELMTGMSLDRAKTREPAAKKLVDRAAKLGYQPLLARARDRLAGVLGELGSGKPARAMLMSAAAAASAGNDLDRLVTVYTSLVDVEAKLLTDYTLADSWVDLAEGTLARLGPRNDARLRLLRGRANVALKAGRLEDARAAYETALELARTTGRANAELDVLVDLGNVVTDLGDLATGSQLLERAHTLALRELGPRHPKVAGILHNQAVVAFLRAEYVTAERLYREALVLREAAYGADDVTVATSVEGLGIALQRLGRVQEAYAAYDRALRIFERRYGAEHADFANALNDVGAFYHQTGDYVRELEVGKRALAIREKALGPDHPDVAQSLVNIAVASKALGAWDAVFPNYRRAIAIYTKSYGDKNFMTAVSHLNYAEALRVRGELDAAGPEYELARGVFLATFGEDHPNLAHIWNGVGQLALARGKPADAIPLLEKAVALREKDPGDAAALAESRFALARALGTTPRAKELAAKARDGYRAAGAQFTAVAREIDAWLARP